MGGVPGALRSPRRVAAAVAAVAVVVLVLLGQVIDAQAVPFKTIGLTAAIGVSFTAMAALVLAGVPGHPVGRLMLAAGGFSCASVLAASWAGWLPLAWLSQWSGWPPLGLIVLALLVFPDGRLPSRRWWPLTLLIIVATVAAAVALAVAAVDHPRTLVTTGDTPLTDRALRFKSIAKVAVLAVGVGMLGVLWSLGRRWRRADGATREQLACLLPAGALFLLVLVLEALNLSGAWFFAAAAVPAAMTVAVLRYRLYNLDRIINRGTVWLVMSVLVIGGFLAIVALLRDVVMAGRTANASLAATGLIAVAFEPTRRRIQRGVDHLFYGDLDNPHKIIARLGDVHGRTTDPDAVLPLLAETIARSMHVPYVAVEVAGPDPDAPGFSTEHGSRRGARVEEFDMVAQGQRLGRLLIGTRSDGGHFSRYERELLAGVAQYAAVVTDATRLIHDLQDSRERLVTAREEERKRLRRELHDGVGPGLTGLAMQVRAARKAVHEPTRAGGILDDVTADLQLCTSEVRQLLDELPRPAELDDGLEAALRVQCRRFDNTALTVDLHVAERLDGLPAAIEVAAYRIVSEALTNVAKHARAGTCRITVDLGRSLDIVVVDDGVGIANTSAGQPGVGLHSMRERAAELGGECVVTRGDPVGTAVRVELPLPFGATVPRTGDFPPPGRPPQARRD